MSTKKKLPVVKDAERTMLPEVLPDPRTARARSPAPRQRTIAHMQRMLTMGAAVGLAFGCGKTSAPATGGESRGCGKGGKTTTNDAGDVTSSSGYAVVDPMPTPVHCPDLAPKIHATALGAQGDGGDVVVDVYFPLIPDRKDVKYVADAAPVAYNADVVKTWHEKGGLTVRVKPQAGTQSMTVSVKITCDKGPGTIAANLSMPSSPKPGQSVSVYLTEY